MNKIYRPDKAIIIVLLFIIACFVGGIGWASAGTDIKPLDWLYFALGLTGIFGGLIAFLKNKIMIDDASVTYSTLLKTSSVNFKDVSSIYSSAKVAGVNLHGVDTKYEMIISSQANKVVIPIKLFSKKDLAELSQTLIAKCNNADINDITIGLSKGKMPSAFFK